MYRNIHSSHETPVVPRFFLPVPRNQIFSPFVPIQLCLPFRVFGVFRGLSLLCASVPLWFHPKSLCRDVAMSLLLVPLRFSSVFPHSPFHSSAHSLFYSLYLSELYRFPFAP